jgi:hypothetical protein
VQATRPEDDNSNDSGVSFALDRGSLIGLDCPQRLGKLPQAEVTQGKLKKSPVTGTPLRRSEAHVRKADYTAMYPKSLPGPAGRHRTTAATNIWRTFRSLYV